MLMELDDAKAYLSVVKREARRREKRLKNVPGDFAYDQWLFHDAPFISDLCLVFLVALRHHVERQLLSFAAFAVDAGRPITRADYKKRQAELQELSTREMWNEVHSRLGVNECVRKDTVKALRLLANDYKHNPHRQPSKELLKHLRLNQGLKYGQLPESGELRRGLALSVGLPKDSGYIDITESFVRHVDEFLTDVQNRNTLSSNRWRVSFGVKDFAH